MANAKAAIYCRVSTLLGQDVQHQLVPLRDLAANRGFVVANEYCDKVSGTKFTRPSLDLLVKDARQGKFKIVLIAALDRLGRDTRGLLNLIHELDQYGVSIISVRESLDFSTSVGKACLVIFGAIASLERDLIAERIRTALAVKKALAEKNNTGWRCGRPKVLTDDLVAEIIRLRATGLSIRAIEKRLNKIVSHTVIGRVVRAVNKTYEKRSVE